MLQVINGWSNSNIYYQLVGQNYYAIIVCTACMSVRIMQRFICYHIELLFIYLLTYLLTYFLTYLQA